MDLAWATFCGYSQMVDADGGIWKASLLGFLPVNACCQLRPQMGLSVECLHVASLCGLSLLIAGHLGCKSKSLKRSREPGESLL